MTEDQNISTPTDADDLAGKNRQSEGKITFDDFDKLNLKTLSEDVLRIIEGDRNFARNQKACTISLNAGFGQGKTTFLEMLKSFLEEQKEGETDRYAVLFIDAWRDDFSKEPIIAILLKFLEYLEKNKNTKNKMEILKIIGILGCNFINQAIKKGTGLDFGETGQKIKAQELGEVLFNEFKQRQKVLIEIKSMISEYTKDGKKLVVIVDELDRARPDYAIHFLEDIKHFFDIENVVFIFGINKSQIEATVKTLYGENLEFDGYYAKFFKHEIDLPDPYIGAINLVDNLLQDLNISFEKFDYDKKYLRYSNPSLKEPEKEMFRIENTFKIYLCCKIFNLTLREISSCLRVLESILRGQIQPGTYIHEYYLSAIIFFTCLYIKKRNIFTGILNRTFRLEDFLEFINKEGFKALLTSESFYPDINSLKFYDNNLNLGNEKSQQIINMMNNWKKGILIAVAISFVKCNQNGILEEDLSLIKREFPDYKDNPLDTKGQAIDLFRKIIKRKSFFKDEL